MAAALTRLTFVVTKEMGQERKVRGDKEKR